MFSVLSKLGWFFKEHWKRYSIAVVLLIVVGILEVIPPKIVGNAIDAINLGNLTKETLIQTILVYTGLLTITYILTYFMMYQLFGGAFVVERILRSKFMRHLLKMTPSFYEKIRQEISWPGQPTI